MSSAATAIRHTAADLRGGERTVGRLGGALFSRAAEGVPRMRRRMAGGVAVACVLVLIPGTALASTSVTLVVNDDRAQCSNADFGTIAGAVAAAKPGDTVRVCPGVYRERVDITKRLHLIGRQEAVDRVRCIDESW